MAFEFTKGYENYAVFPMHYLRITQSWDKGNHIPHWDNANYKDYPVDLGGSDGGRDYLYAPVDMKVVALNGIGSSTVSNKVFLESVNKVVTPKYGTTKIFMTAVHFNDSDVSKFGIKVGKIYKRGEPICFEGVETATANHLHFTCGIGSATKSIENNNGKWVTKGDCKKPEEIFFIDKKFNNVINLGGKVWSYLPKKVGTPVKRDKNKNQIEVLVPELNVRNKPNTNGTKLGFANIGIYDIINSSEANGYTWYEIEENKWIASKEGIWTKFYKKEDIVEPPKNAEQDTKGENSPIIPPSTETSETDPKEEEIGVSEENKDDNFSIWDKLRQLILDIINLLKKK